MIVTDLFRPMLASDADLDKLRFPLLASAKLDGIRAVVKNGVVLSRSLKPIPNDYVQSLFWKQEYCDGELIVGDPTSKTCYRDTVSGVMSKEGTPDVHFHVFDHFEHPSSPYMDRMKRLKGVIDKRVVLHAQHVVTCLDTLLKLEEKMLNLGYEGLILRSQHGHYKFGRSTSNEQLLLKMKRMKSDEAEIIGFTERQHNGNEATINELGRTKRSSHKENLVGRDDLGALIVRFGDIEFNIGTGFTDDERNEIWANRNKYLGKIVKFKYFPIGMKDAPRHPVYEGVRDSIDL